MVISHQVLINPLPLPQPLSIPFPPLSGYNRRKGQTEERSGREIEAEKRRFREGGRERDGERA